ncbi:MAG: hypothetical protein AAFW89_14220 [Bacteroidota bacterium]
MYRLIHALSPVSLYELTMGLFWDIIQQGQIDEQKTKAASLEERIEHLENELRNTQELLNKTLHVLEEHVGKDIDGDGRTG